MAKTTDVIEDFEQAMINNLESLLIEGLHSYRFERLSKTFPGEFITYFKYYGSEFRILPEGIFRQVDELVNGSYQRTPGALFLMALLRQDEKYTDLHMDWSELACDYKETQDRAFRKALEGIREDQDPDNWWKHGKSNEEDEKDSEDEEEKT